jgi:hypothetical protein
MRVWRFDRIDIYAVPPFSVNEDGRRFVTVVLGYLLMANDELGFDPTIDRDTDRRYVPVMQDGVEQGFLIEKTISRQASILATCWKVTVGGSTTSFDIKDSWQYDGKDNEGDFCWTLPKREFETLHQSITVHRFALVAWMIHSQLRKEGSGSAERQAVEST